MEVRCCVASVFNMWGSEVSKGCSSWLFEVPLPPGGAKGPQLGFATGAAVAGFFIEQNGVISLEASCSF